jgi:hypothetical protein
VHDADKDASGTINFTEFLTIMVKPRRRSNAPSAWTDTPIELRGRIAQSALAGKAKFYEQQVRALS